MKSKFSLPKENTKSLLEKNYEEEEFKKYDAIITKFSQVVTNKNKSLSQAESEYSNKRSPSLGKNKSLIKMTVSRTKDDRNDKDFLSTFMNNDALPILPKNLHLLSDNDTNLSISNTEKFKNLSNLMIDDKETYSENCFIRNAEDRLILQLYTTLGREAKEIFLEEENSEKLAKKRLLFHKLNDIKIPKFEFNKPIDNISNTNIQNNEIEFDSENNQIKEEEKNEDEKENENECYFKQKEKGYFHIPELINIKQYKKNEKKNEDTDFFWDPEMDADTLSYINHNIIRIEDIYNPTEKNKNKKNIDQNTDLNNEDIDEDKIIAVNAKEIISSESENEEEEEKNYIKEQLKQNKKNQGVNEEEEEIPKKSKIKFSEFCGISPYQIEVSCQVDQNKVNENKIMSDLRDKYTVELNRVSSYDEKHFPINGIFLSNDLIYRIAEKNKTNEICHNESLTILPTLSKYLTDNSGFVRKDFKKKTVSVIGKTVLSSINLSDSQFTLKNNKLKQKENNQNINNNNNQNSNNESKMKEESKKDININSINNTINNSINNTINKSINCSINNDINNINNELEKISKIEEYKEEDNKLIDEKDIISNNNINNNINNIEDIRKVYTLKDIINNDNNTIISNKDIKKINDSKFLSENEYESFSVMKDKDKNKIGSNLEEINIKENDEFKNNTNFNFSHIYSNNDSGSQNINNDLKRNLTFSSRQS